MEPYGKLRLLLAVAPLVGGGPLLDYFERDRKPPRWKRLGYTSEAEYCKRTPKPEKAEDKPR